MQPPAFRGKRPSAFRLSSDERLEAALPFLLWENLYARMGPSTAGPLLEYVDVLHERITQIPRAVHDDAEERKQAIMVLKATNNGSWKRL
jgi:hypothetical protein